MTNKEVPWNILSYQTYNFYDLLKHECNRYLIIYLLGDACNQWNFPTGGPTNAPTDGPGDNIECFACGYKVHLIL